MKKNIKSISELKPGSKVHLMGICGTAMASLAGLLKDRGFKVQGSDSNPYPPMSTQLEALKIPILKGYRKENLEPRPDFVIVGNVISASNEEAKALMDLQIPFTSLPKAMGELIIDDRQSFVVSGTHGKTTTTSILAWALDQCELEPGFLIGGIPKNFDQSFRNPGQDVFVIEGDEYDTAYFDKVPKFMHYRPQHVILTSVEFDHADIYKDFAAVKSAFLELMKLIPAKSGHLVYCADDPNVKQIAEECSAKKLGYGFKAGEYRVKTVSMTEEKTVFDVEFPGAFLGQFEIQMGGDFNVLNATAVIAMAHQLYLPLAEIQKALKSFKGVKRRQEVLGEPGGILVIEDFAHHPTAVRETILGIQKKYSPRKFFSVFEPRSATSRRKVFQKDYVEAFRQAHDVILAEAFDQSKINEEERFSVQELIADLRLQNISAKALPNADQIVQDLTERAQPGDGILIMSNGGFDGIYDKLMASLKLKK